jgi:fimbrial isopeptide formation D2 family protein
MHSCLYKIKTTRIPMLVRVTAIMLLFVFLMLQGPLQNVLAQTGTPQLILTKSIEGGVTTAQVGDSIRYRIRFECSSLVGPCGEMKITDVLQNGLDYNAADVSIPAGFSISYDSTTHTITITKDDNNLLDGSQYDAVISASVSYDLRPLPATINNTVNGQIKPQTSTDWITAAPASAPPITIGTITPSWGLTKTLISPSVNPTVNTNVTYQIQLCPKMPVSDRKSVV